MRSACKYALLFFDFGAPELLESECKYTSLFFDFGVPELLERACKYTSLSFDFGVPELLGSACKITLLFLQGVEGAETCLEEADPDPGGEIYPLPFLHPTPRASARGVIAACSYCCPPSRSALS